MTLSELRTKYMRETFKRYAVFQRDHKKPLDFELLNKAEQILVNKAHARGVMSKLMVLDATFIAIKNEHILKALSGELHL